MALPHPNRAQELKKKWEEEHGTPDRPPKRNRSFVTYLSNPEEIVEVPLTTPGDVFEAEELWGQVQEGQPLPYNIVALYAQTEGWMVWKALHRHPEEGHRPKQDYKSWRDTVDQIWTAKKFELPPLPVAPSGAEEPPQLAKEPARPVSFLGT